MKEKEKHDLKIKNWNKIIRKVWDDSKMKEELLQDPHAVLKKHGIDIPKEIELKIHENTDKTQHFVLPQKPNKELSDDFLSHIVAGLHYAE